MFVYVFTLPLFEEESPYFVINMTEIPNKGRLKNARFILAHSLIGISVHHGEGGHSSESGSVLMTLPLVVGQKLKWV